MSTSTGQHQQQRRPFEVETRTVDDKSDISKNIVTPADSRITPSVENSLGARLHIHVFGFEQPVHPIYYFEGCLGAKYTKWLFKRRRGIHSAIFITLFYLICIACYTRLEAWTRFEVIYFLTVTSFTVGYGDYHPTSDLSRLLTMLVIIIGLAFVLAEVTELINQAFAYIEAKSVEILQSVDIETQPGDVIKGIDVHIFSIIKSIIAVVTYIIIAALIFYANEGDDMSFVKALYFAVVTLTTVGYGDIKIHYTTTRVFLLFYITLSVIVVGSAIGNIATARSAILAEKTKLLRLASSHESDVMDMLNRLGDDDDEEDHEGERERERDDQVQVTDTGSANVNGFDIGGQETASASTATSPDAVLLAVDTVVVNSPTHAYVAAPASAARRGIDKTEFLISMLVAKGYIDRERDVEPLLGRFDELDSNKNGLLTRQELIRFRDEEAVRAGKAKDSISRDLEEHRQRRPHLNRLISRNFVLHDVEDENVQRAAASQIKVATPQKQRSLYKFDVGQSPRSRGMSDVSGGSS